MPAPPAARPPSVRPAAATAPLHAVPRAQDGRVLRVAVEGAGVVITIARGSDDGVGPSWSAELVGSAGRPLPDGTCEIVAVEPRVTRCRLRRTDVPPVPRVRLGPPVARVMQYFIEDQAVTQAALEARLAALVLEAPNMVSEGEMPDGFTRQRRARDPATGRLYQYIEVVTTTRHTRRIVAEGP